MNGDIYTVKSGDTLYSIANRYGVSVDDLRRYNNLNSDVLSIGDQLMIPVGQITEEIIGTDYDTYIVKSGDTLYSIANRYGVNVDELRNINNLSNDILIVNQRLLIPKGYEIIDTEVTNYINYIVKSGDTLYSISRNYGVSVDELRQINNLVSDNLSVGQVLRIPSSETTIYTVKNGDTLYSIARKYNLSVDELKALNNLSGNFLSVGQVLNVR
ncbi:MAG: LysM peptidoglycan-binding domain-containing protein [Bacilli bacterium]|nr:LysM peptidoglycan-binding domain-containing protein [Bacilli bacterium]